MLRTPSHPLLPSEWARHDHELAQPVGDPLPILLLWTTAGAFVVIAASMHRRWHILGFAKAQEGADHFVRGARWNGVARRLLVGMPVMRREFILKDLRVFFRDSTQWSQLILLGVLVPVMLINVQMLPLDQGGQGGDAKERLIAVILFAAQGLTGFVIAGNGRASGVPGDLARRAPALAAPLLATRPRAMLRSKYLVGVVPLLVLALALTLTTSRMLHASDFMTSPVT